MRQSWQQWTWLGLWLALICAGCDGQLTAAAAPAASNGDNEPTVEVVPLRSVGLASSLPISVEVQRGDISVVALSAANFFNGAIFIEDDIFFLDNITETLEIKNKAELVIQSDHAPATPLPQAVTHVRVPENAILNLHTRAGSIYVAGKLGNITAVADGGKIEVRGQTGALNLTAQGDGGITVDGEPIGLLTLTTTGKGAIDVTVGDATPLLKVTAASGSVIFSGRLAAGDSFVNASAAGPITLVMPRELNFDFHARTDKNPISIQYPIAPLTGVQVCVTMDPGWPVDAHFNSTQGRPRAQVTVKPASDQITTPVIISGTIGLGYLMFHTTMHGFNALVPDLSDLSLDQVNSEVAYPQPASQTAILPTAPIDSDAALRAGLDNFMNQTGLVATAVPLAPVPAPPPANPVAAEGAIAVTASGRAIPMKGHNCQREIPPPAPVRIHLSSAGGQIRILQMSPGS